RADPVGAVLEPDPGLEHPLPADPDHRRHGRPQDLQHAPLRPEQPGPRVHLGSDRRRAKSPPRVPQELVASSAEALPNGGAARVPANSSSSRHGRCIMYRERTMADTKQDVLDMLRELAELTMLDEGDPQSFRVRAYESAAHAVEAQASDLGKMTVEELQKIE